MVTIADNGATDNLSSRPASAFAAVAGDDDEASPLGSRDRDRESCATFLLHARERTGGWEAMTWSQGSYVKRMLGLSFTGLAKTGRYFNFYTCSH